MRAIRFDGPEAARVVDVAEPERPAGSALVELLAAGICATDLSTLAGSNPLARYPLTPGHECVGRVRAVDAGSGVDEGARVTVYPTVGCGTCEACREGRFNHCPTFRLQGMNVDGGCFAERFVVPVDRLVPIPAELGSREAALVEPTAVAEHVVGRGGTVGGRRALVVGAGVIGLLVAQVARARGAREVVLVDRFETRREIAERLGFERFVLNDGPLGERLRESAVSCDVVYDSVCSDATVEAAAEVLTPGGRLVLVATPKRGAQLRASFTRVYAKELTVTASRNYLPGDFRAAIADQCAGAVEVAPLITDVRPLAAFEAAMELLRAQPEAHLKVLLEP